MKQIYRVFLYNIVELISFVSSRHILSRWADVNAICWRRDIRCINFSTVFISRRIDARFPTSIINLERDWSERY